MTEVPSKEQLFAYSNHAPDNYISSVEECDDELAVLIFDSFLTRAYDILCSEKVIEYYRTTEYPINGFENLSGGHCEDLACYVYECVERSEYDESRVRVLCMTHPDEKEFTSMHCWLELTTEDGIKFHFDADTLWGVTDYRHLVSLRSNPYLGTIIGEVVEKNPLKEDPDQVLGIYGCENDSLNQR